jgi:hypothetical protein
MAKKLDLKGVRKSFQIMKETPCFGDFELGPPTTKDIEFMVVRERLHWLLHRRLKPKESDPNILKSIWRNEDLYMIDPERPGGVYDQMGALGDEMWRVDRELGKTKRTLH